MLFKKNKKKWSKPVSFLFVFVFFFFFSLTVAGEDLLSVLCFQQVYTGQSLSIVYIYLQDF